MQLFVLLLFLPASEAFELNVNQNRGFLFGDVLEPLCSVSDVGQNLTSSDVIEIFHAWEKYTSSQLGSAPISEYRKAMPCFPGPSLNLTSSNDTLPAYPNCESFVNISKATLGEVEDLLEEFKKSGGSRVDVSLKSVMNSLGSRLQNLIDYLPEGATKNKTQVLLYSLTNSNSRPMLSEPIKDLNPLDLLNCFNISTLPNLSSLASQNIGSVICSIVQICSFSDVSSNQCLSRFNISQLQYDSLTNKTVGDVLKGSEARGGGAGAGAGDIMKMLNPSVLGSMFDKLTSSRIKRTVSPEDVTPGWNEQDVKFDGGEEFEEDESSGMEHSEEKRHVSIEDDLGNSTDTSDLLDQLLDPRDDVEASGESSGDELQSLLATKLNASIVQFGVSFISDSSIRQKVSGALNGMDGEFTVAQLLDKMNVSSVEELKQLLSALQSVMGTSDFTEISQTLENVSMSGFYLGTMLQNMFSGSSAQLENAINEKIAKSGLPLTNEEILRKGVTLPMTSPSS